MKTNGTGKGNHPNSRAVLKAKAFKKGVSGNPKGRAPGVPTLKERMKKYLDLDDTVVMEDGTIVNKTVLDSVILSLIFQAKKGNINAIKEIFDRSFGKEPEKLEIEDNELRSTLDDLKESMDLLKQNEQPY